MGGRSYDALTVWEAGVHWFRTAVAIAALAAGMLGSIATAEAAFPGQSGKIAFSGQSAAGHDLFTINPNGEGQLPLVTGPTSDSAPAWSPDGTKVLFDRMTCGGVCSQRDIWVVDSQGGGAQQLTGPEGDDLRPDWSPDGTRVVYARGGGAVAADIWVMDADGGNKTQLTSNPAVDLAPAWSPDGSKIAFTSFRDGRAEIYLMSPDGSGQTSLTPDSTSDGGADWSPNGARIVFERGAGAIYTMNADGSGMTPLVTTLENHDPVWAPNASKIAFRRCTPSQIGCAPMDIYTVNPDGTSLTNITGANDTEDWDPSWQPLPFTGYARPIGATPHSISLVPAYAQCAAPSRTHGPPLAFPSCNPPAQASPNLTVGTPDAGGGAANSIGRFYMRVVVGTPGLPDDSGAPMGISLTDVRCKAGVATCGSANAGGGADYTGKLRLEFELQLTDKWNAAAPGGGPDSATMTPFTFSVPTNCNATASTAEGGSCTATTDVTAVIPGVAKDGKRAIWAMGPVRVLDGGPDGNIDTPNNSLFAVQGIFVP